MRPVTRHCRIADHRTLKAEIAVWERQRNAASARIEWTVTRSARFKLLRAYPDPDKET